MISLFEYLFTEVDDVLRIVPCSGMPAYEEAPYGSVLFRSLVVSGYLQEAFLPNSEKQDYPDSLPEELLKLRLAHVMGDFWPDALGHIVERFQSLLSLGLHL